MPSTDDFAINPESLSDEERAILEEEIAASTTAKDAKAKDDEETTKAIEAATATPDPLDDEEEEDEPDAEPDADAAADTGGDDGASDDEPKPAPTPVVGARPQVVELSAEETARIAAIEADKDKLLEDFDSGELTRDDFKAKVKALDTEAAELAKKQAAAELSLQQAEAYDVAQWHATVAAFNVAHPEIGKLWAEDASEEDRQTAHLWNEMVKEHATRVPDSVSDKQMLDEALALFNARYPGRVALPESKVEEPKADAKPKKKARPAPPPRLGKLPAADLTEYDGSVFGKLNDLAMNDGAKLEEVLAKMTPAQLEAYQRAN